MCPVDRNTSAGFCRAGILPSVSRIGLHAWEEPPISGDSGSGAIFFCGCNLRCVYCQNSAISTAANVGRTLNPAELAAAMLNLQEQGALNINLVTPTPHIYSIVAAIRIARAAGLKLPIVYNTNSYVSEYALTLLDGLIDIYLADLKYVSDSLSLKLSGVDDYFTHAVRAIQIMLRQCGRADMDTKQSLLKSGVIIRHLVLPNNIDNTRRVLDEILLRFGTDVTISLMGQYFPAHKAQNFPNLNRKLLPREYERAIDYACSLGFHDVWIQKAGSNDESYVPRWDI